MSLEAEAVLNPAEKGLVQQAPPEPRSLIEQSPSYSGQQTEAHREKTSKSLTNTSNPRASTTTPPSFFHCPARTGGSAGASPGMPVLQLKISLRPHIIAHMAPTPTGIIAWNFPASSISSAALICFHVWRQLKEPNTEAVTEATSAGC